MGAAIRHYMNPLHVYCRLRDMGIAKGTAVFLCRFYECSIYRAFFAKERTMTDLVGKGGVK